MIDMGALAQKRLKTAAVLYMVDKDKSELSVFVCTVTALHAFHKDAATLRKDPVTSLVAVLSNRHGAQ